MRRSRTRTAAGVALLLITAAVVGVGAYFVTQTARRPVVHRVVRPPAPADLALAGRSPAPPPGGPSSPANPAASTPAGVRQALARLVGASAFGGRLGLHVVDLASGTTLEDRAGSVPVAPASTAKLLTAAALLAVRRPTDRLPTTVRAGAAGTVVLVGGGDPTLSGAPAGAATAYPHAARLSDLAARLRARHIVVRHIVVDGRLFTGPAVSPSWAAEDVPSDYAAPITGLLADGGRDTPAATTRSTAPDLAAGHELARALGAPTLPVTRAAGPPASGPVLAAVESAPLDDLVEQMLLASDNVLAESLGRQVALATGRPASFTGAASAIRSVLAALDVRTGTGMRDASGLARADRIAPVTLTAVLALIARTPRLRDILLDLPAAAWSGTLAGRYRTAAQRAGVGAVRAKTGTLTGVAALAGVVHTADGRLWAFAALSDRTPSTPAADEALDALATRLAGCGCR